MLLARSGRDVGQTKYEKQDMYIYICVCACVCYDRGRDGQPLSPPYKSNILIYVKYMITNKYKNL